MDELFDALLAWQVALYLEGLTPEEYERAMQGSRDRDDDAPRDRDVAWWRRLRRVGFPRARSEA